MQRLWAVLGLIATEVILLFRFVEVPDGLLIDWGHLAAWVEKNPRDDVVAAITIHLALLVTGWLVLTAVVYALAAAIRIGPLLHSVDPLTAPIVRRAVDKLLAATLTVGFIGGPGDLSPGPPAPPQQIAYESSVAPPGVSGAGYLPTATTSAASIASRHVVVAGDNLWTIAAAAMANGAPQPTHPADVASYWLQVIEANRSRLRSGDPDLIFPGEVIVLPPPG